MLKVLPGEAVPAEEVREFCEMLKQSYGSDIK